MKIEPGTTALITGASSGIGEHFARQLAARGVDLVLVARSEQRLLDLSRELEGAHAGVTATVIAADLSSPQGAEDLTAKVAASGTAIDLLVNNAGFGSHDQFVDEDPEALAREIQLNCSSLVGLTARLLPDMVARGRGGVINVASTAAFQPIPSMAVYAATKAFVLSFTEAVWAEVRSSGVRVIALCPGATETNFFEVAAPGKQVMTRRQTPEQVVESCLRFFEHRAGPTVVTGWSNRLLSTGYRFAPRWLMPHMAAINVRAH